MSESFIFLSVVLGISIALCAYLFYSIPFISRLLRTKEKQIFDVRLLVLTLFFYTFVFVALEMIFLSYENCSFCLLAWPVQGIFFSCVTILVFGAIRLVTGDLLISAPQFYIEKLVPLYGDFESDTALFFELITKYKGEVILDALDKKIIIAKLPLASFEGVTSQQEVILECTFSESFLKNALVQIVCYPASRGVFIEKTTMNRVLENLALAYTEKILKSLA